MHIIQPHSEVSSNKWQHWHLDFIYNVNAKYPNESQPTATYSSVNPSSPQPQISTSQLLLMKRSHKNNTTYNRIWQTRSIKYSYHFLPSRQHALVCKLFYTPLWLLQSKYPVFGWGRPLWENNQLTLLLNPGLKTFHQSINSIVQLSFLPISLFFGVFVDILLEINVQITEVIHIMASLFSL